MKIAFLGLGNMGVPMSACILNAKYDLTVWNRTPSKMQPLIGQGAKGAATAREAASGADIVITGLMDDPSVLGLVQGGDGILQSMKPGAIHLCISTISPRCAETLEKVHEARGTGYVSGPVVGRPDAAAAAKLTTYLAGKPPAIDVVLPVCRTYASQVTVLAERPGAANCMKLAINYNIAAAVSRLAKFTCSRRSAGCHSSTSGIFLFSSGFLIRPANCTPKRCARAILPDGAVLL